MELAISCLLKFSFGFGGEQYLGPEYSVLRRFGLQSVILIIP